MVFYHTQESSIPFEKEKPKMKFGFFKWIKNFCLESHQKILESSAAEAVSEMMSLFKLVNDVKKLKSCVAVLMKNQTENIQKADQIYVHTNTVWDENCEAQMQAKASEAEQLRDELATYIKIFE